MHFPERWGYLYFAGKSVETKVPVSFTMPYSEKQKKQLWLIYYKQKGFYQKHRRYASSLSQLGFPNSTVQVENRPNTLKLEASNHQFMGFIQGPDNTVWCINQDGFVQQIQNKL